MAIVWGAWDGYNRFRVGLDLIQSPAVVTSGTSSVTVTAKLYVQTRYYGYDSGVLWTINGAIYGSGTVPFNNTGDMGISFLGQVVRTFAPSYVATVVSSFNGSMSGWTTYPDSASVSTSITTAKRPYIAPNGPVSVTATRVSDTNHTITWVRNPVAAAPYESQYVERWDIVTNKYATVAPLNGTATTYSNTNTIANRQYRWRVRARNSAGYSGYTYSGYLSTTPAAPTGTPVAAKDSSGNIVVTWSGDSAVANGHEVWHLSNGVLDGVALNASLSGTAVSYTHMSPNNLVTHQYQIRAKTAVPALTGPFGAKSNVVQLLATPNAPTSLTPNGVTLDASSSMTLKWKHNPVDTTPQSKYELQYRVNGGSWVSTGVVTSTVSQRVIPANTWVNGQAINWQVRTYGAFATVSPWSAVATVALSSPPAATINSPDGSPYPTSELTVTWGYYDAEGTPQTQWSVFLYDADNHLLETKTASNANTSAVMGTILQDGLTYWVGIQVRDSAGSYSSLETQSFTVSYAKPAKPQLNPVWDEEHGIVGVEALSSAPGVGEVETEHMHVWRSLDGGVSWLLVSDDAMPGSTVTDSVPPLNSTITYKVDAVSASPSVRSSDLVDVYTDSTTFNRVWLNVGPGFATGVFLSPECDVDVGGSREAELVQYSGRDKPVEYSSDQASDIIAVKGVHVRGNPEPAVATSTPSEWREAVKRNSAPMCLRNLRGNRWWVSVKDVEWGGAHRIIQSISFVASEVDWTEPTTVEVVE